MRDVPRGAQLSWPFLTKNGLLLIAADESEAGAGRFFLWTRTSWQDAFSNRREIKIAGDTEIFGRSPFFVEATGELFFTSTRPRRFQRYFNQQTKGDWNFWIIEGVVFPQ